MHIWYMLWWCNDNASYDDVYVWPRGFRLWFRYDQSPQVVIIVALYRSRGVAMVQIWPEPPSDFPVGIMPIKRCSYGSDTTKPPSDFPRALMPIKRCNYGSNPYPPSDFPGGLIPIKRSSYGSDTTNPPSDFLGALMPIKRCDYGSNIAPKWYCELCSRDTHVWAVLCSRLSLAPYDNIGLIAGLPK